MEDVGGEVQGEHHADPLGLQVVGSLVGVGLVAGGGADVGDGQGHRVGGLGVSEPIIHYSLPLHTTKY